MELARGTVAERPWALTLANFARRGSSGQLTLIADQKRYSIAFDRGAIVAARSPMTADSVARVALTKHLVTSSHVAELTRLLASAPDRDDVDLLGELANLTPPQVRQLRLETITRRAARTFAVETGAYIFEDKICLPTRGCEVDARAVVYQGIRMHLTDARLVEDLRALGGTRFALEPHSALELNQYKFADEDWPILAALRDGTTLPELEARHRGLDPRTMQAIVYSLVACGTARVIVVGRTPTPPSTGRTPAYGQPVLGRTPTPPPSPAPLQSPPYYGRTPTPPLLNIPMSTRDLERVSVGRTKTNPELAAEAAERATRALAVNKPEDAVLELKRACELVPTDVDYNVLLGWALFCAADDKIAMAAQTKRVLEQALHKSRRPYLARFYLGRVERMLGHDVEALHHFLAVLMLEPNHRDASAEVRVLEARLGRSN